MIEPIDFLSSAEDMLTASSNEVVRRNCISRAYYSAYHACLSASSLLNLEMVEGDYGSHIKLIRALKLHRETCCIGRDLDDLKRMRTKADYFITANVSRRDTDQALLKVQNLLSDLNKLFESKSESASE